MEFVASNEKLLLHDAGEIANILAHCLSEAEWNPTLCRTFTVSFPSKYRVDVTRHPTEPAMHFLINGKSLDFELDVRISLLDLFRERLGLTGTKKGCNQGACGACTVLVDGERINSCLALAVQYQGRAITTVEGLAEAGNIHPLQHSFIEHDGFQCGYCTPGQLCSAIGMADEIERGVPSAVTADLAAETITLDYDELRERMSGNLCRCGAYNGIVEAITDTFTKEPA